MRKPITYPTCVSSRGPGWPATQPPCWPVRVGAEDEEVPKTSSAFSLLEVVIIIGILGILAAAVLPILTNGRSRMLAFECLNHHRQLCEAWRMYAEDNAERLVPNSHGNAVFDAGSGGASWAIGWLDWSTASRNTNVALLINPKYALLAPYVNGATNLFKCPADRFLAPAQLSLGWQQRVRSVSANIDVGEGNAETGPFDPTYRHVRKLSDFLYPTPAETHVFLDEHPDSINDPAFFSPRQTSWIDLPAVHHHGGAAFGFADCHVEIHRWRGSLAKIRGFYGGFPALPTLPPGDPDVHWMSYHTSRVSTNSY